MPAPNLARVSFSLGTQRIRVRTSTGAYVDGRWIERGDQDRILEAAVRPISPSDRRLLPEGMRTEDTLSVLVHEALNVEQSPSAGGVGADRLLVDGIWWRVVGEKPWTQNGFRRYIAVREADGRERNL